MFKEMKLSTKFGLALLPLVLATFALLAFVLGSNDDGRPSLGWVWIAIAGILGSGGVMYSLANSMTVRLNALVSSAQHMSQNQVPQLVRALADKRGVEQMPNVEPIDDHGSDEIGELAESFNFVQGALVGVATEQMDVLRRGVSEIFVTLARRSRSLVDRQLALLDELESDVEDPKLLGDYYRLDHIATRMRRNAESLLVLARSDTHRRRSAPVSIDDVVRAGISEIEDYQRAQPLTIEPAAVHGPVIGDLAHMLAELLDNATAFSPPGSDVTIAGAIVPGGYAMTIRDYGIGIGPERLIELNELLTTPPVVGLSVEPTLGLSVVSLLAEKHGVTVQLHPGPEGGTITAIFLPAVLFAAGDFPGAVEADDDAIDAEWRELVGSDAINAVEEVAAAPSASFPTASGVGDRHHHLPPPSGAPVVSSPPAPGPVASQVINEQPHAPARVVKVPVVAPPVVEQPVAESALAPQLPGRVPGAAAPKMNEDDTRHIDHGPSGAPARASAWDTAISTLERSTASSTPAQPALVLPTRSRGENRISDEVYTPVAQTATDPEELRNKLNAFRSMSTVPASAVPYDSDVELADAPNAIHTNEGSN